MQINSRYDSMGALESKNAMSRAEKLRAVQQKSETKKRCFTELHKSCKEIYELGESYRRMSSAGDAG